MFTKSKTFIDTFLFIALTLSWSFTWFASKYLVNSSVIMPEILASYRFFLAGVVILLISVCLKISIKPTKQELKTFTIVSLFGCSINLILFYYSSKYLISGFSSIIFSMVIICNLIIGMLFGIKQSNFFKVLILAIIGVCGLAMIITSHIGMQNIFTIHNALGIGMALLATIFFSISSVYHQTRKNLNLHPLPSFSYMCIIGSLWCLLFAKIHTLFSPQEIIFTAKLSTVEIVAFLYLAIFGTAIGYLCSFTLVRRIGSVKTGYSSLIIPILSLSISCFLEGYQITLFTITGLALIVISEFFALRDKNIK